MKSIIGLLLASVSLALAAEEATTHMAGRDVKTPGPPGYQDVKDNDRACSVPSKKHGNRSGFLSRH